MWEVAEVSCDAQAANMQSGGQGPGPVRRWDHLDIMMDQLWNLGKREVRFSHSLEWGSENTQEKSFRTQGLDEVIKHDYQKR